MSAAAKLFCTAPGCRDWIAATYRQSPLGQKWFFWLDRLDQIDAAGIKPGDCRCGLHPFGAAGPSSKGEVSVADIRQAISTLPDSAIVSVGGLAVRIADRRRRDNVRTMGAR